MKDNQIIEKINTVLQKTNSFFEKIDTIPNAYISLGRQIGRQDNIYYRYLWLHDINHQIKPNQTMFSFNAEEIKKYKIPSYVVGCSGRADMFAKYAKEIGLEGVYIIPCVKIHNETKQLSGHQIIAVKMSHGLQLLNPACGNINFNRARINSVCKPGQKVDALQHGIENYIIAAILTPEQHEQIDSFDKLNAIYNRVFFKRIFTIATKKLKGLFSQTTPFIRTEYENF